MGAADIVPGVSGGTIAFITGIYERLIFALKEIPVAFIQLVKQRKLSEFWSKIDGTFLLTLFSGIIVSALLLARLITFLLKEHPIPLWAFFFGLILASVWIVSRQVSRWHFPTVLSMILGVAFAWGITSAVPIQLDPSAQTAFISGLIAICAMILPGISGSFILVILGTYAFILEAVKGFDLGIMSIFMLGCVAGLLTIANLLAWAFKHYHNVTLSLLTGFMIGALNKVWPWKEVLSYRLNRHGEQVPLIEQSVMPSYYESISGVPSQLVLACVLGLAAMIIVIGIDHYVSKSETSVTE